MNKKEGVNMSLWLIAITAIVATALIVGVALKFGDMMFQGLEEDGDDKKSVCK